MPEQMTMLTLKAVIAVMKSARRIGGETDVPEGTRYIQISDTLAKQMAAALRKVESND